MPVKFQYSFFFQVVICISWIFVCRICFPKMCYSFEGLSNWCSLERTLSSPNIVVSIFYLNPFILQDANNLKSTEFQVVHFLAGLWYHNRYYRAKIQLKYTIKWYERTPRPVDSPCNDKTGTSSDDCENFLDQEPNSLLNLQMHSNWIFFDNHCFQINGNCVPLFPIL